MAAPENIVKLVARFDEHLDAYKQGKYNETQLRREFIDPMFEALGWDVANRQDWAEAYKEVVHEDAVKVGGITKAPDYSFRIGGVRKFFLEAKKPSINIKQDTHPAFQLRRYAWSAKLPVSILTDFEEFAVYDCRVKPVKTDGAASARVLYLSYDQYIDRWEEIAGIFSREAIYRGAFDRFVKTNTHKRGTAEVDDAFLQEIERWRTLLARNIALRNPQFSQPELNYAVQLIIDRIVFLRICEDRGVEDYGRLQALLNGSNVYARLFQLFQKADARYNSGLFHFRPEKDNPDDIDGLTPHLTVDDKAIKEILRNLYYPDSPYEFSVISADILGQVYERFLGRVIRLTPSHQAKIEDKPEVRKAGGVFYTPTYIVDYIVRQTVGELVRGKKPWGAVKRLKILDPACGSGSFLLGAYEFLLNWHLDAYVKDDPEKWRKVKKPAIYQDTRGAWRLTTDEKKRILTQNIFGVDIDPQAVEVTKLSLLLKVLEDESQETLQKQLSLFQERVLPNLNRNIRCGNSLIGTDIFSQGALFADASLAERLNPFDWSREFSDIMGDGGFDAVIGNPPYVRQELIKDAKSYFKTHYETFFGTADLYIYFIEKAFSLLRENGRFGFIVANKWMRANYGKSFRQWLKARHITGLIDFGDLPVFQSATAYPCILLIKKNGSPEAFHAATVDTLAFDDLSAHVAKNQFRVKKSGLEDAGWTLVDEKTQDLLAKLRHTGVPLGQYVEGEIYYGIKTGLNKAFVIDGATRAQLIADDPKSEALIRPFALGKDIKRYQPLPGERYLILIPKGWTSTHRDGGASAWQWFKANYPAIAAHLAPWAEKAKKRCDKGEYWWELRTCDYYEKFEKPKIIVPAIVKSASYTLDQNSFYSNDKTSIIASADFYLLGILNSSISDFVICAISSTKRGGYFEYKPMYIQHIPIMLRDHGDNDKQNQIAAMAEKIMEMNRRLADTKVPVEKERLRRQIEAADRQIDQCVYALYGLTPGEIEIVEKTVNRPCN